MATSHTVTVTMRRTTYGRYDMVTLTMNVSNVKEDSGCSRTTWTSSATLLNAAAGMDVGMVMASEGDDILMFSDDSMYYDVDSETGADSGR